MNLINLEKDKSSKSFKTKEELSDIRSRMAGILKESEIVSMVNKTEHVFINATENLLKIFQKNLNQTLLNNNKLRSNINKSSDKLNRIKQKIKDQYDNYNNLNSTYNQLRIVNLEYKGK